MTFFKDSLQSMTNRMPSAYVGGYDWELHNTNRWREYYIHNLLARVAVDRIPEDCFRKGYTWGGADPQQMNLLNATERRLRLRETKKRALTFARLDGEAYIYMDDGTAADQPMDYRTIRKDGLRFINMLRITDVVKGPWDIDPLSAYYMQPQWYQVTSGAGEVLIIHPSRMAKFIRNPDPNNGLGTSDLAQFYDAIEWLKRAEENVSELTTEARIDVMSVEGLFDAIQDPELEREVIARYTLAADLKRTNKMLVIDKGREEYAQKSTTFTGLTDVIESYRRGYCSAIEVPYALIYGRQGGLGSNGETDLLMYYDNIATIQRNEITESCFSLNEAVIRSALGNRPDEIFIDWLPLHEVSEKDRVDNANKIADTIDKLVKSQAVPADVLTQPAVNWLVELGALPGLEQSYNEWKDGGGVLQEESEESDLAGQRGPIPQDEPEDDKIPPPVTDANP